MRTSRVSSRTVAVRALALLALVATLLLAANASPLRRLQSAAESSTGVAPAGLKPEFALSSASPAPFSGRAGLSTVSRSVTNEILVIGGRTPNVTFDDIYFFLQQQQGDSVWRKAAAAPFGKRYGHQTIELDGGEVVLVGGNDGTKSCNDVYINKPANGDRFDALPVGSFPPREGHGLIVVTGEVILAGGANVQPGKDGVALNDVYAISQADLLAGKPWTKQADAPWTPRHSFGFVLFNWELYVIGGAGDQDKLSNEVWKADAAKKWTQLPSAPFSPRMGLLAAVWANQVVVSSGYIGENKDANDVWLYSLANAWSLSTDAAPFHARHYSSIVVYQSRLLLVGGEAVEEKKDFNDVYQSQAFSPAGSSSSSTGGKDSSTGGKDSSTAPDRSSSGADRSSTGGKDSSSTGGRDSSSTGGKDSSSTGGKDSSTAPDRSSSGAAPSSSGAGPSFVTPNFALSVSSPAPFSGCLAQSSVYRSATDEVLLIGGVGANDTVLDGVWFLSQEPATVWRQAAPGPFGKRYGHQTIELDGGEIILVAGNDGTQSLNDVYVNKPANGDRFDTLAVANFPPRELFGLVSSAGGVVLAFGGVDKKTKTAYNDVYAITTADLLAGKPWAKQADAPWSPRFGFGFDVYNDELYVIGGAQNQDKLSNEVWRADAQKAWTQLPSAPFAPRVGLMVATWAGQLVASAGLLNENKNANDVYLYAQNTWQLATDSAAFSPRNAASLVGYHGRLLVVGGGSVEQEKAFNDVYQSQGFGPSSSTGAAPPASSSTGVAPTPFPTPDFSPANFSVPFTHRSSSSFAVLGAPNAGVMIVGGSAVNKTTGKAYLAADVTMYTGLDSGFATLVSSGPFIGRARAALVDVPAPQPWAGVFLLGGMTSLGKTNAATNDVWVTRRPMLGTSWQRVSEKSGWSQRYGHQAVYYRENIVLIGGYDVAKGQASNDVFCFDTSVPVNENATWYSQPLAHWAPRYDFAAQVIGEKLFIAGGTGNVANTVEGDVWMLPGLSNKWQLLGQVPLVLMYRTGMMNALVNGEWIFAGGLDVGADGKTHNDMWSLNVNVSQSSALTVGDDAGWTKLTDSAGWPARADGLMFTFQERLVVTSGVDAAGSPLADAFVSQSYAPGPTPPGPTPPGPPPGPDDGDKGLKPGIIALIVIVVLLVVGAVAALVYVKFFRNTSTLGTGKQPLMDTQGRAYEAM